jgi:hypothetical protein
MTAVYRPAFRDLIQDSAVIEEFDRLAAHLSGLQENLALQAAGVSTTGAGTAAERGLATGTVININSSGPGVRWQAGPWWIASPAVIRPASIPAGQINNYSPTNFRDCIIVEVSSSAAGAEITGLLGTTTDADGTINTGYRVVYLVNVGLFDITLKHQGSASAIDQRFYFPGAADYTLSPNVFAGFMWRVQPNGTRLWVPIGIPYGSIPSGLVTISDPFPTPSQHWFSSTFYRRSAAMIAVNEEAPTITGAGSVLVETIGFGRLLTTNAIIADGVQIGSPRTDIIRPEHDPSWTIIVKTGPSLANLRIWCALLDTSVQDSDTLGAGGATKGWAFRYSTVAADGGWVGVARDGAAQSVTATVGTIAVDTIYKLKIRKSAGTLYFSVNGGTEIALSTNLPASGTDLFWVCGAFTREAVAKSFGFFRHYVKFGISI